MSHKIIRIFLVDDDEDDYVITRDLLAEIKALLQAKIGQLFQNLIGNAIKCHRSDVKPVIRIEPQTIISIGEPDYYRIDVVDNGIGFNNSYTQKIFGLFQRLHGRDQYDGTGLGLTICKKIVTDHGGGITASGSPNEGATFTLRFPVKRGECR
jgi:light-regulated signal transduction histidine kinase (bacteriophytochrome)